MSKILFVHGPGDEFDSVIESLRTVGFQVLDVESSKDITTLIYEVQPDLVIIAGDLDTQRLICSQIRALSDVPLIAVGGRDDEVHRVAMLDLGADICLSDPVITAELVARVKSLLRRCKSSESPILDHEIEEAIVSREDPPIGAFLLHTAFNMKVGTGS
ncbi:MAG: response regulator transcription factor [Chloroflexi bacterium]|nr:response regulator transcription factor [Chloroflexota bacterium]